MSESTTPEKVRLNWRLTACCSFLLGTFGVDRFMMRHYYLGVFKLLTFGGVCVLWLIDFIAIFEKRQFKNVEWT